MYRETITQEEISLLPPPPFDSEVVVLDTEDQEEAVAYLSSQRVIGFDTESRPSFRKGVQNKISLLQLSGGGKTFLIRLNKTRMSKGILKILQSRSILKVGAAIRDDVLLMQEVNRFTPRGFVDLQNLVGDYGIHELSLKKMSAIVLGVRVSKAQRLSNWSAQTLTSAQTRYAAIDAWICREIYFALQKNKDWIIQKEQPDEPASHLPKA